MKASVVVPAWNEDVHLASNLTKLVDTLKRESLPPFEIVIVDDGSTDDTLREAQRFASFHNDVRVIVHPANRGVSAAIATGVANARGDVVVVLDADLSYDPSHVGRLIDVYVRTGAPIVVASPYMSGGTVVGVPFERRLLSSAANAALALADRTARERTPEWSAPTVARRFSKCSATPVDRYRMNGFSSKPAGAASPWSRSRPRSGGHPNADAGGFHCIAWCAVSSRSVPAARRLR